MTRPCVASSSGPSGIVLKDLSGTNLPFTLISTVPVGRTFSLPGGGVCRPVITSLWSSPVVVPSGASTSVPTVKTPGPAYVCVPSTMHCFPVRRILACVVVPSPQSIVPLYELSFAR